MSRLLLTLSGTAAILFASLLAQEPSPAPPAVTGPPLTAPELFKERGCQQCHVIKGEGGDRGPALTHIGRRLSKQQLETQILKGGGAMPAYESVLTPAETTSLVAYLHTMR